MLIIASFAIGVRAIIARNITELIVAVASAAHRVAAGDLTVPEIRVCSEDEIGQMAHAFNKMVHDLRETTETNNRLLEEATERSRTDSLTGARNYRYLMELLCGAIPLPQIPGKRPAVIFLELDQFDEITAAFGHLSGDTALEQISQRLLSVAPDEDEIIRVGAKEFVIMLPVADEADAKNAAESLREGVGASVNIPTDIAQDCPTQISVSVGIAVGNNETAELQMLIRKADHAMSLARGRGGNCVISASEHLPF